MITTQKHLANSLVRPLQAVAILILLGSCETTLDAAKSAFAGHGFFQADDEVPATELEASPLATNRDPKLAALDPDEDLPLQPLGPAPVPLDNPVSEEKVTLGKMLFFDPRLSGDASMSCADCHNPREGFGTAEPVCRGYPGTIHWRNCHTVVNAAWLGKLFWDGSSPSLEKQAATAAMGAVAGNGERDVMEARLRQTPGYVDAFRRVFGTVKPNLPDAWAAIAAFERSDLIQLDTPLDRYLQGEDEALSPRAKEGFQLFHGKANCIECHNGAILSDEKYYNLGLPRPPEWGESGLAAITFRYELYAKGVHEDHYRDAKDDMGLYFSTKNPEDMGKFRVQPLRYLKFTAPYMHAGQFYTLEEVIDFYDAGGGENEFTVLKGNKTEILKPLGLTDREKASLVTFLEEISGEEIEMEKPALPPFEAASDVATLSQAEAKKAGLEVWLGRQALRENK